MPIGFFGWPGTYPIVAADISDLAVTISKLGFGVLQKVAETTVTGSPVTSISFTGLNLNTDKVYWVFYKLKNASASASAINLYFNNDTTATNYYRQRLYVNNTTLDAGRTNDANWLGGLEIGARQTGFIVIQANPDGNGEATIFVTDEAGAGIALTIIHQIAGKWSGTANITRIDFTAGVTNAIAVGSRISIFKLSG